MVIKGVIVIQWIIEREAVPKPDCLHVDGVVTLENYGEYARLDDVSVKHTDGIGRNKGKHYIRLIIQRPVVLNGTIYERATSQPMDTDGDVTQPFTFTPGSRHPYDVYEWRRSRWHTLSDAVQTKVQTLVDRLREEASDYELRLELLVQVGEVMAGKRQAVYSQPFGRLLHDIYGIETWADLQQLNLESSSSNGIRSEPAHVTQIGLL